MSIPTSYLIPKEFYQFDWVKYSGQNTSIVTYMFLRDKPTSRLIGESSILYIGKTQQAISSRYKQETRTKNTSGNSQATNIRTSYVFQELLKKGYDFEFYFTHSFGITLQGTEIQSFGNILQIWNKNFFLKSYQPVNNKIQIPTEKFLLVHFANTHLEVPPLNNSV